MRDRPRAGVRHGVLGALLDPKVLILALARLDTSAGLYTAGIWTPLILKGFGFPVGAIGLVAIVPSAVAAIGMALWSRSPDRTGERHCHAALACLVAALGLVPVAEAGSPAAFAVLELPLTALAVNAAKPPPWGLPTTFLAGSGAAAGIALIDSLGTLERALGRHLMGTGRSHDAGLASWAECLSSRRASSRP